MGGQRSSDESRDIEDRDVRHVELEGVIQATMVEVSKRVEVTVDDVVAGLHAEAEGKKDSTASTRVAAWALLGKHLGMDRKDIQLKIDQPRISGWYIGGPEPCAHFRPDRKVGTRSTPPVERIDYDRDAHSLAPYWDSD